MRTSSVDLIHFVLVNCYKIMEWCISPCGKYRVETLKPETFSAALQVIREAFTKDEFVCQGTEVCKHPEAREELLELCADSALDGVSVVAVEIQTGAVVAACFNKLQVSDPSISEKPFFEVFAEERCKHPSSKALIQFMAGLDERINTFEIYGVDCSLELMFLATLREHRERKLGFLCCKASIDLANKLKHGPVSIFTIKDLGPKYSHMKAREITRKVPKICQMLCTSVATQNIAKALNFTVHLRTSFTEFVYKGMNYVQRAGFDPYCEVVALRLQ